MNLDDMFEEASEESFWRKFVRNKWLRKSILSAVTVASVLYGLVKLGLMSLIRKVS